MNILLIAARVDDILAAQESIKTAVVRKEGDKYCVRSEKNKDWSGGCYDTKEEATERLKQVEMFKHMK